MIKPTCVDTIKKSATAEKIVGDLLQLKTKGNSLSGDCPFCNSKKKFSVNPKKDIWKCFSCDEGGKGGLSFVMKYKNLAYPEALQFCADMCNIIVEEENGTGGSVPEHSDAAFRNAQLEESGISDESQRSVLAEGSVIDRYEAGSFDKIGRPILGNDMLLHYVNLEGERLTYLNPFTQKLTPFVRIRFQHPELNLDKKGNPIKYKQPFKSGSHLWIPEFIRQCYTDKQQFKTLIITEGEKKADKLCLHGLFAVAIMGIHNLSFSEVMSEQFIKLIKACGIEEVVFLLDADWQDLSDSESKAIESRPNTFFRAVQKFKNYFYHYNKDGISLDISFAYIKSNEAGNKGADDLLRNTLKDKEDVFRDDFLASMADRKGKGEYVNCHRISTMTDYNLKKFWHLENRDAFFKFYYKELTERKRFKFGRQEWEYDGEDDFVMVSLLPEDEQYWVIEEKEDRAGNIRHNYVFDYQNIRVFLRNQGYGRLISSTGKSRFIHSFENIIEEIDTEHIANYVVGFTEKIGEPGVLRMLLRGGKQYLGSDKLARLYEMSPPFLTDFKECQYLFFKNGAWCIFKDTVTQYSYKDLPGSVWNKQILNYMPNLSTKPMIEVSRKNGKIDFTESTEASNCHMLQFLKRTSDFDWEKDFELLYDSSGGRSWELKKGRPKERKLNDHGKQHFICKMLAIGYVLHSYQNKSETKAVICMDGKESEVGMSEGGTGKSLFGEMITHIIPTLYVDGKKQKITEDQFIYEQANERTKAIFFDDCRSSIDFENFFGQITRGITVNEKGVKRYSLPAPKFIFTTNHAISGEGNSFKRRQYLLAFSDWYNSYRKPTDDFGCSFYDEWDETQWSLFFNFATCCIQSYLKFGLSLSIPADDWEQRKLRQYIGENFLDWASLFFANDNHINKKVPKEIAYGHFLNSYPVEKRYCSIRKFKNRIKKYCQYKKLDFNPIAPSGNGGDIKTNGTEFFIIANKNFDPNFILTLVGTK